MNESKFSKHVCAIIKSTCGGHVSRVEAAASAAGIPDLDYCVAGIDGHIELKVGSDSKPPDLRPSQVRWFKARLQAGGRPFFLCLNTDRDEVYLLRGSSHYALAGTKSMTYWRLQADIVWQWGDDFSQGLSKILKGG